MWAGLAGGLLVFTGLWHATEFMMGGRNADTRRLIPVGIVYLILGILIVTLTGGWIVQLVALIAAGAGAIAAFTMRGGRSEIRGWVIWAFILIDAAIVAALAMALLG